MEQEYFKQRADMKKVESKTKTLEMEANDLRLKLKEKESLLRITKYKLNEVSRGIKHG